MENHGTADEEVRGWTLGQLGEILAIITRALKSALDGRNPKSVIEKLSKSGKALSEGLAKLFREILDSAIFLLTLDGSYSASELIKKGKYDFFNDWITDECFPIQKHKSIKGEIELVEFDFNPSSEDVLEEFKKRGLSRPIPEDAFYFGIQYPEEQRKRPIVFLHEPVLDPLGGLFVLVLGENAGRRGLGLSFFGGRWVRGFVFVGVRK